MLHLLNSLQYGVVLLVKGGSASFVSAAWDPICLGSFIASVMWYSSLQPKTSNAWSLPLAFALAETRTVRRLLAYSVCAKGTSKFARLHESTQTNMLYFVVTIVAAGVTDFAGFFSTTMDSKLLESECATDGGFILRQGAPSFPQCLF